MLRDIEGEEELEFEREVKVYKGTRGNQTKYSKNPNVILLYGKFMMLATSVFVTKKANGILLSYLCVSVTTPGIYDFKQKWGDNADRIRIYFDFDTRKVTVRRTVIRGKDPGRTHFINCNKCISHISRLEWTNLWFPQYVYDLFEEFMGFPVSGSFEDLSWIMATGRPLAETRTIKAWYHIVDRLVSREKGGTNGAKEDLRELLDHQYDVGPFEKWQHVTGDMGSYIPGWEERARYIIKYRKGRYAYFNKLKYRLIQFMKKGEYPDNEFQREALNSWMALQERDHYNHLSIYLPQYFAATIWRNPHALGSIHPTSKVFKDINVIRYIFENSSTYFYGDNLSMIRTDMLRMYKTEPQAAKKLIQCYSEGYDTNLFEDLIHCYTYVKKYYERRCRRFGEPIPKLSLKGPMKKVHDYYYREYNRLTFKPLKIIPPFKDTNLLVEKQNLLLHYPTTSGELVVIGQALHNCVGGYGERARSRKCFIFVVKKGERYIACCEVNGGRLIQCYGRGNSYVSPSLKETCEKYVADRKWPAERKSRSERIVEDDLPF